MTETFRTTFDLTGFDPTTASIDGLWGTDNVGVDILLNGVSLGISLPGVIVGNFSSLHAFTIASGFQSGVNTLDFVVFGDAPPSAFRAELSGAADTAAAVAEPGGLDLLGIGLVALGLGRLRHYVTSPAR